MSGYWIFSHKLSTNSHLHLAAGYFFKLLEAVHRIFACESLLSFTNMSSTSPHTCYSLHLWIFGFGVLVNVYLLYSLKYVFDRRKAYVERHSGDNEDQAVKDKVEQIKKLMDRDCELQEKGLVTWLLYWPHKRGILVAMVLFVLELIWFILDAVILESLVFLFMALPLACRRAIKRCKLRFQRQEYTDDIEMTAGSPRLVHIRRDGKAMGAFSLEQHEHTV